MKSTMWQCEHCGRTVRVEGSAEDQLNLIESYDENELMFQCLMPACRGVLQRDPTISREDADMVVSPAALWKEISKTVDSMEHVQGLVGRTISKIECEWKHNRVVIYGMTLDDGTEVDFAASGLGPIVEGIWEDGGKYQRTEDGSDSGSGDGGSEEPSADGEGVGGEAIPRGGDVTEGHQDD